MKKLYVLLAAAALVCGAHQTALAQADPGLITKFITAAQSAKDGQLGTIATELTGKMQALGASLGVNDAIKAKLDTTLKSLTGGTDLAALESGFDLVKSAKLTPDQMGLAKQVGNLASAYVVQKNFASLEGASGDVATIVSSLRAGNLTSCISPLKNVAANTHMTDPQKKIIGTVADKYAPGWRTAKGAVDAIKKLPGF